MWFLTLARKLVAMGIVLAAAIVGEAKTQLLVGCYERAYDAAHLAAHKGQLVVWVTLSVRPPTPELQIDKTHPIVATGDLKVWVQGINQSFDPLGACNVQGDALLRQGSVSAAEADQCTFKQDGVHERRINEGQDVGSFLVEVKPEGVLVPVHERLELVQALYDGGPFLYLSPTNAENHAFLLRTKSDVCR